MSTCHVCERIQNSKWLPISAWNATCINSMFQFKLFKVGKKRIQKKFEHRGNHVAPRKNTKYVKVQINKCVDSVSVEIWLRTCTHDGEISQGWCITFVPVGYTVSDSCAVILQQACTCTLNFSICWLYCKGLAGGYRLTITKVCLVWIHVRS